MSPEVMKARCEWLVIALVGKANAQKWWESRNKAFDLRTPKEVWETEPDKVYEYLMGYAGR